jgi:hypothetical protein
METEDIHMRARARWCHKVACTLQIPYRCLPTFITTPCDIPQEISAAGFKLPDCVDTLRIVIMIILHRDGAEGSLGSENILRHDPRIISSALIKKNSIKENLCMLSSLRSKKIYVWCPLYLFVCCPLFDQRKFMYVVLFIVHLSNLKKGF